MRNSTRRSVYEFSALRYLGLLLLLASVLTYSTSVGAATRLEQQGSRGTNTFLNYHNASGFGPGIAPYQYVEVSCKVYDPFIATVNPDGYWYRLASAPWNDQYFAPANTFWNGDIPGQLPYTHNTDFSVPDCGALPAPSVTLAQGPAATYGFRYAVTVDHFPANSVVSVNCRDSVDPSGFYTFSIPTDVNGHGFTQSYCYSADGPEHWVVVNGSISSNRVSWGPGIAAGNIGGGGGASGSGVVLGATTSDEPMWWPFHNQAVFMGCTSGNKSLRGDHCDAPSIYHNPSRIALDLRPDYPFGYVGSGADQTVDPTRSVPVYPVANGVVIAVEASKPLNCDATVYADSSACPSNRTGNFVVVRHTVPNKDGTGTRDVVSVYRHLSSVNVTSGSVTTNTVIGTVGNSGYSTPSYPHLHLEIHEGSVETTPFAWRHLKLCVGTDLRSLPDVVGGKAYPDTYQGSVLSKSGWQDVPKWTRIEPGTVGCAGATPFVPPTASTPTARPLVVTPTAPGGRLQVRVSTPNGTPLTVSPPSPTPTLSVVALPPNRPLRVVMNSLPIVVGKGRVGQDGTADVDIDIPRSAAPGEHFVYIYDDVTGGLVAATTITVPATGACPPADTADDSDGDTLPDDCDLDASDGPKADNDGDGVPNSTDSCPTVADASSTDSNDNNLGDVCDPALGASRFSGFPSAINSCAVGVTDAVAWWSGDNQLSATLGPDLSGSVAYGTGQVGQGFAYDGTASTTVVGTFPTVDTAVTVEAWIKPVPSATTQTIFSRWDFPSTDDSARGFALFITPNNFLEWTTDDTSARRPEELYAPFDPAVLYDGTFHHVAATWDGVGMTVYLDGVQIGTMPSQGGALNQPVTTPVRVGSAGGIGAPFVFNGVVDEPAVYGRALTLAEISSIVAAGGAGKCA